jgi:hypothetical protein
MGRQQYYVQEQGSSMMEAYSRAVMDAVEEHGHEQGHSGEINMSNGFDDITREFKNSGKKLADFVSYVMDSDRVLEDEAMAICIKEPITNTNTIKTQVKSKVVKGTRKWILWYVAYETGFGERYLGKKKFKDEAIKVARKHTENTKKETVVVMERLLEDESPTAAIITYKPSSTERKGTYYFFGEARS